MQYNTQRDKLRLPEYGRNIQQMVEYCKSLEDVQQRNECAFTIASMLGRLFDDLSQAPNEFNPSIEKKVWDTINLLAGYNLDVDFPCQVITEEAQRLQPQKVPYGTRNIKIRTYGKNIEQMINAVMDMEQGPARDEALRRVANHMKKQLFMHNKEAADNSIVIRDIEWYTQGVITLDPATYQLNEYVDADASIQQPQQRPAAGKKHKNKIK